MQRLLEDVEFAKTIEAQVREKLEIDGAAGADVEIEVEDEDGALMEEE